MAWIIDKASRKFLNQCRFALPRLDASVLYFLFEVVSEGRRTEALPDGANEGDGGGGDGRGVACRGVDGLN